MKPLWVPRPINLANDFVIILSTAIKFEESYIMSNLQKSIIKLLKLMDIFLFFKLF